MNDEWLPEWFSPVFDPFSAECRWMMFHPSYLRRFSLLRIRDIKALVFNLYHERLVSSAAPSARSVSGYGLKEGVEGVLKMPAQ